VVEEENKEENKKKGDGVLKLNNVSISTMKDDLASEKSKGGDKKWLGFFGKDKKGGEVKAAPEVPEEKPSSSMDEEPAIPSPEKPKIPQGVLPEDETPPVEGKTIPPSELLGDSKKDEVKAEPVKIGVEEKDEIKDKVLDSLKMAESDKPIPGSVSSAPSNLPVVDGGKPADKPDDTPLGKASNLTLPLDKKGTGEKSSEDTLEKVGEISPKGPPVGLEGLKKDMGVPEKKDAIPPAPKKDVLEEPSLKKTEEIEEEKNPFSAKLSPGKEGLEKKPGLSAVESAINYSAPKDFVDQRKESDEAFTEARADKKEEPEAPMPKSSKLQPKLMLLVAGGGVIGLIAIVVFVMVLGGSKKEEDAPTEEASVSDTEETAGDVLGTESDTISTTPDLEEITPGLTAQKFLENYKEVEVTSSDDIRRQVDSMKRDGSIDKMTQIVFMKAGKNEAVSYADLISSFGIAIPSSILASPDSTPALFVMDRFGDKTVVGIVLPMEGSKIGTLGSMKSWETTMINDLKPMIAGLTLDNPEAYFSDSGLFDDGRFALIDKASGLSLDYAPVDEYIAVTFGKDSMEILNERFSAKETTGTEDVTWGASADTSSDSSSSVNQETYDNTKATSDGSATMNSEYMNNLNAPSGDTSESSSSNSSDFYP